MPEMGRFGFTMTPLYEADKAEKNCLPLPS
jgi:hypothetical protein